MDRGKRPVDVRTDSGSTHSSSNSNIGPLKKQRIDYDEVLIEKDREIEYWKNAYLRQHHLYQVYSHWAKDEMERMATKHKMQLLNIKNMAAQDRAYFTQALQNIVGRMGEVTRQVSVATSAVEGVVHDYSIDEIVPRFQEPWVPSLFGGAIMRDFAPSQLTPVPNVRNVAGTLAFPNQGHEGFCRTARMSVRPPSINAEDLAWIEH